MGRKLQVGFLGIGFVVVGAGLFVAGWFGKKGVTDKTEKFDFLITDNFAEKKASEDMEKVDGSYIRKYLEELASVPHMAGLDTDENLAKFIQTKWKDLGLDQVRSFIVCHFRAVSNSQFCVFRLILKSMKSC